METSHLIFFQFSTEILLFLSRDDTNSYTLYASYFLKHFFPRSFLPFLVKQKTNTNTKNIITTQEQKTEKKEKKNEEKIFKKIN